MSIVKLNLPDIFFELDQNWKNAIHLCNFKEAEIIYEQRTDLIPTEHRHSLGNFEDYLFQTAEGSCIIQKDTNKAIKIANYGILKEYRTDDLKELLNKIDKLK